MKIDRLLKIVIYLLNHENVSARDLAERLHVSVRTIQRDMVSIAEAGIPVYSNQGKGGGYSILPSYKVRNCNIHQEEQQLIQQALESLATSYANETLAGLIEKYHALLDRDQEQSIFFDFGIAMENQQVQKVNQMLKRAIETKALVDFFYRDRREKKHSGWLNLLLSSINGIHGIYLHGLFHRRRIVPLKLHESASLKLHRKSLTESIRR